MRLEKVDKIALGFVCTTAAVAAVGVYILHKLDKIDLSNLDAPVDPGPVAFVTPNSIFTNANTIHQLKRQVQELPLEDRAEHIWNPNALRLAWGLPIVEIE